MTKHRPEYILSNRVSLDRWNHLEYELVDRRDTSFSLRRASEHNDSNILLNSAAKRCELAVSNTPLDVRAVAEKEKDISRAVSRCGFFYSGELMIFLFDRFDQLIDVPFRRSAVFFENFQDAFQGGQCSSYARNLRYLSLRELSLFLQPGQIDAFMPENLR